MPCVRGSGKNRRGKRGEIRVCLGIDFRAIVAYKATEDAGFLAGSPGSTINRPGVLRLTQKGHR